MAQAPAVTWQASDLFGAGVTLLEQRSSSITVLEPSNILDADGNMQCETMVNSRVDHSCDYDYCNGTPDIKTDLGTLLSTFGAVADGKVPTQMVVNFEAGQYASVSITGHNHTANPHTVTDWAIFSADPVTIPASAGFGVPTFTGWVTGDNSTPIRATVTYSCNHIDRPGYDGNQFTGVNRTFRCEIEIESIGTPGTGEITGFTLDSSGPSDGNVDPDTSVYRFHMHKDKV